MTFAVTSILRDFRENDVTYIPRFSPRNHQGWLLLTYPSV